jgi:hypothetical protein
MRGRSRHALQAPMIDLQIDAVLGVFQRGLQDQESIEVRVLNPFFLYHFFLLKRRSRFAMLRCLLLWHFLAAADSTQLAVNITVFAHARDVTASCQLPITASTWVHIIQLFDIVSKNFKLSLSIYIPLDVAPHL